MSARWSKLNESAKALKALPELSRGRLQKEMDTTAFQVARGAEHRAARASGKMARAIGWKSTPRWIGAIVGVDKSAFYWKFLEYGTVKMEARPFLRPAGEAMAADHDTRVTRALGQALNDMEREAKG